MHVTVRTCQGTACRLAQESSEETGAMAMKHRIVVLGAGYAGAYAAGSQTRRLDPADAEVTVVNAEPDFVERMRLHQLAAGQELRRRPLTEMFAGTGIRLRLARVEALDPDRRTVVLDDG